MKYKDIKEEDIEKVQELVTVTEDGCYLFPYMDRQGYPQLQNDRKYKLVHRMVKSYELQRDLGKDDVVHHTCHNSNCVNPHHLQLLDRDEHNEIHCKFSDEEIAQLVCLHIVGDRTLKETTELANVFFGIDCSVPYLSLLMSGKSRKELVKDIKKLVVMNKEEL